MTREPTDGHPEEAAWTPAPPRWGWADAAALACWTLAILVVFREIALLRGALYYFDITEINYPYRDFLAREIRLGRFSRWLPDLYCGLPLYSESQAGYWHPLKYVLYPWMATWKALNLDTTLSIWLAGVGTYGWLRRHVGPLGALTGAGIFALGGFTWAHLIHTSMINALGSVPFVVWSMEVAWDRSRYRPAALGGVAIAFQVFAGHLQDTILTLMVIGLYALLRITQERSRKAQLKVATTTALLAALGIGLSAVQWVPSKELLDRSPRAEGLTWENLTYGSWHPELLPTVVMRETYGTRARDTDWMDGFYPYHEMDTYLGVVGLFLVALGAQAYRQRWVASWAAIAVVGLLMMLGRFTFLVDFLHRVPVVGSSRIPVRFHLWVSLAVAALGAVGVDRLRRPGRVRLRGAALFVLVILLASIPIAVSAYSPAWTQASRWVQKDHQDRFAWLFAELTEGALRVVFLSVACLWFAAQASKSGTTRRRAAFCCGLPVLVILDLWLAHRHDVATVDPRYWTETPASVAALRSDPSLIRMYGEPTLASGEPGYASKPVNPFPARDVLAWSLPTAWGVRSTGGETPIISTRRVRFGEWNEYPRYAIEGLSHILSSTPSIDRLGPARRVGDAYLHTNPRALPRVRLVGRPVYATDECDAAEKLKALGAEAMDRVVIESGGEPMWPGQEGGGEVSIKDEVPERVVIRAEPTKDSFLLLADTYDPGWTATIDGQPTTIFPANVAFRAVFVPKGAREIVFRYEPAGFRKGLFLTLASMLAFLVVIAWSRPTEIAAEGRFRDWPRRWPWAVVFAVAVVLAGSVVGWDRRSEKPGLQARWHGSRHAFTWGAGIEAMKPPPPPLK